MRGALRPGEQDARRCGAVADIDDVAPARGREQRRGEQRQRERPFQLLGENGIGEPGREEFALRCPAPAGGRRQRATRQLMGARGRERRQARTGDASLGGGDRRLQRSSSDGIRKSFGGARDRGAPLSGRSGRERAPGQQPASRRSGIGARPSEVERVAQRRLVFAAAGAAHAGGGGSSARRWRQAPAQGGFSRTIASSRASAAPARNPASASVSGGVEGARPGRERRRGGGRET